MKIFLTVAVTATLALAGTAHAAPASFWFNCSGAAPLQNLVTVDGYSWSDTAPTASYQSGAGCGWLDPGFPLTGANQPNELYDSAFGGDYKGEVRKLEFTLYAPSAPVTTKVIGLGIMVDGEAAGAATGLTPVVGPGPDAAISSYTYTVFPLDIPSSKSAKNIVLAVQLANPNDTPGWLQGAKEVPSGARLFAFADLTPEEQAQILDSEVEEEE